MTENLTTSNSPSIESKQMRSTWLSGCITILAVLLVVQGIWTLVVGSIFAYVFFSSEMLSPITMIILLIVAGTCIIYFFLAFRLKRQHWLISLTLLALVWLVLPLPLVPLFDLATMRLRNDGFSMAPTLQDRSYIIADRQSYEQSLPQRGDIVIFQFPLSSDPVLLIKRIIGLPGEVVSINEGQVSIDGVLLDEPYILNQATYSGEWIVPDRQYFVLGDNRPDSRDSHQFGTISRENIIAKAVWIYAPLSNFGEIVDYNTAP